MWRARLVCFAGLALALVLILQAFDVAYAAQIGLWLAAVVLVNAACRRLVAPTPLPRAELAFLMITLVAAFVLRTYALELYPTGLHGDEGSFGLWAVRILDGERIAPFALGWDFHPTLFHYAQAAAMAFAGRTAAGVRLPSAVVGSLTIVPLYFLLRRQLGRGAAQAGIVLLAVLPWHLYFSRLAVDDIGVALCAVGAMAALPGAARRDDAAVAAGSWLGLSFYFGHKAVMVPAMMAVALVVLRAGGAIELRRSGRRWCLLAAVAGCVVAPQFAHYARAGWYGPLLQHPLSRLAGQGRDKAAPSGEPITFVARQVERSLLAFQLYPDRSIFLSFTRTPLLSTAMATLGFVGFVLSLRCWRQPLPALALAWLAVGLLGSILTMDPPQAHHLVPMIAVPIVFAAMALAELQRVYAGSRWVTALVVGVVALTSADAGRDAWLNYMRPTPWLEVTEIARAMRALHQAHDVVLVTAPMSDHNGTLQYIAGDAMPLTPKLYGEMKEPWRGPPQRDVAFIVSWRRYAELPKLRSWYPNGREYKYATAPGADFLTIYEVSKNDVTEKPPLPEAGS